eukprot:UN32733
MEKIDEMETDLVQNPEPFVDLTLRASWFTRYWWMVVRYFRANYIVDVHTTMMRFGSYAINGLALVWLFWDLDIDQDGSSSRIGVLFTCLSTLGFTAQFCIPVIFGQRNYLFREQKSQMHTMSSHILARLTVEWPTQILEGLFNCVPIWSMVRLKCTFMEFLMPWTLCYMAIASMSECTTAFVPEEELADGVMGLYNIINIAVAGFMIRPDEIPDYWIWAYHSSPIRYSFANMIYVEFDQNT